MHHALTLSASRGTASVSASMKLLRDVCVFLLGYALALSFVPLGVQGVALDGEEVPQLVEVVEALSAELLGVPSSATRSLCLVGSLEGVGERVCTWVCRLLTKLLLVLRPVLLVKERPEGMSPRMVLPQSLQLLHRLSLLSLIRRCTNLIL